MSSKHCIDCEQEEKENDQKSDLNAEEVQPAAEKQPEALAADDIEEEEEEEKDQKGDLIAEEVQPVAEKQPEALAAADMVFVALLNCCAEKRTD